MTIKDLIQILNQHPNPNAEVIIRYNADNQYDEKNDVLCNYIEVFNADEFYTDFIEIFTTQNLNEN
jgi:hypothetical protein